MNREKPLFPRMMTMMKLLLLLSQTTQFSEHDLSNFNRIPEI